MQAGSVLPAPRRDKSPGGQPCPAALAAGRRGRGGL